MRFHPLALSAVTILAVMAVSDSAHAQSYRLCAGEIAGLNGCGRFGNYDGFYPLFKGQPHIEDREMAIRYCNDKGKSMTAFKKTLIRKGDCCGYKIVYATCG